MAECNIRECLAALRLDAHERAGGTILFAAPVPLFVVAAWFLNEAELRAAYAYAIDDGFGDPEDLDPADVRQRNRLEAAVVDALGCRLRIEEVVSLEYSPGFWAHEEVRVAVATVGSMALLAVQAHDAGDEFVCVGVGVRDALLEVAGEEPEMVFPRVVDYEVEIVRIVVRAALPWGTDQVCQVVQRLLGRPPRPDEIVRRDLLAGAVQRTT